VTLVDNQALGVQVGYVQTNLVSDIPNLAQLTDPNLKNPWGTSFSDTGTFSVSDQGDQRQHAVLGDGRRRQSRSTDGHHPDHGPTSRAHRPGQQ
jgi:hypothetical protein